MLSSILKMDYTCPCSICSSTSHHPSKCPELSNALKDGFYKGGNSGGSHSHDDDALKSKTPYKPEEFQPSPNIHHQ